MNEVVFEEIREEHLPQVLDIYTYYVLNTTATFHTQPLSAAEMRELVFFERPPYQTFVILDSPQERGISGYVILTQYKKREAYNQTAEVTVYLKPDCIGRGLGSLALRHIEKYARERGIHALVATICGENAKSIHLFTRNGYFQCAHYREVGRKFGQLLDSVAYQKLIG